MFRSKIQHVVCEADYPVVQTKQGKLLGYLIDDVFTFHGIKYADAGRFQMPQPVKSWDGIKEALDYGYVCPMTTPDSPERSFTGPHRFWPKDENCQYLNVWTRCIDGTKKRPVMFWIHGGGYSTGSSIEQPAYEGEYLARDKDVVVVSINHRLNCLGFLDMSGYGEKYAHSANAGMADIVAALQWVRDNIASFGGDPDNVTIFGQSGGGGKVLALMQMPSADGLYHRAIVQSGVLPRSADPATARQLADRVVENLGLTKDNIEEIETVPYEKLAEAYTAACKTLPGGAMQLCSPMKEDGYYAGTFAEAGFREEAKNIPVMVGSVLGEFGMKGTNEKKDKFTEEEKLAILRAEYGEGTEEVVSLFRAAYPGKDILHALNVDTLFRPGNLSYTKARSEADCAPMFAYLCSYIVPVQGGKPLWHCGEIPYIFRNACFEPALCSGGEDVNNLTEQFSSAWVNFAENGDPNGEGVVQWKPYTADDHAMMIFDLESRVASDHDEALIAAVQKYGKPFRFF